MKMQIQEIQKLSSRKIRNLERKEKVKIKKRLQTGRVLDNFYLVYLKKNRYLPNFIYKRLLQLFLKI